MYNSQLQWGHDKIVMEVEPAEPGEPVEEKLQWGHDKIVMEVKADFRQIDERLRASMGP